MNEIFGHIDTLNNGQKDINKFLIEWADRRGGVMKVITGDVHYLIKGRLYSSKYCPCSTI